MCRITVKRELPLPLEVGVKRPLEEDQEEPVATAGAMERSGKWTSEEEKYADALVEHFENGTLVDCENGDTLRAYLARTLDCMPMRVSKKFAGRCIGKHAFNRSEDPFSVDDLVYLRQEFFESLARREAKRRCKAVPAALRHMDMTIKVEPNGTDSEILSDSFDDSAPLCANEEEDLSFLDELMCGDLLVDETADLEWMAMFPEDQDFKL